MDHLEHQGVENPGKPFSLIFFIEMWERFGYYGMQALIVIFFIKHLGFSDAIANITFGSFAAMVYAFISIGGYVGDKVLGTKRTMLIGAIVLAIGYGLLSYHPQVTIFYALGLIVAGNMMFKANPSSLVSKLYHPGDHRVDGAFTIYYMSINIGSFMSQILCPILAAKYGFGSAFIACSAGLVLAVISYFTCGRLIKEVGSEPDFKPVKKTSLVLVLIGLILMAWLCSWLLTHLIVTNVLLGIALIVTFGILFKFIFTANNTKERNNYIVCFVLIVEAIVFFVLYQQMPTSLNLFAIRNTNHVVFGLTIPGPSFQSLNPFWIVIGSPILALMYGKLGKKGKDFSMPGKFAFGMLLCSLGFLTIPFALKYIIPGQSVISGNWLVVVYGFQSIGELLISGLGLAMVTKLVPQKVMGFMMGAWFMGSAVAMSLGGFVAAIASVPKGEHMDPSISIHIYSNLFLKLGVGAFIICIVMFIFVPKLKAYMK
ncbi:MAG TPA: oligopeptide:H+ symporter [Victivallales bacterium]|nr:oligopeptide:H+ symporter [Victivallales bacterium]